MTILRLLRHAQTDAAPGICYGASDVGVAAGATLALARRVALTIEPGTRLSCSPLRRCSELAHAVCALRPELVLHVDARLAEMDFGAWEGRQWAALPRAEFDRWIGNFADGRPGETGESTRRLMERVAEAFDEWRQARSNALWITHAGVMRAAQLLDAGVRDVERADQWPSTPIAFGECLTIVLGSP